MPTLSGLSTNFFPTPNEGFTTTTSGPVDSSSATEVPLNSVSGLTNGAIFTGLIDPGNAKERAFTGVIDTGGSQITSVVFTTGTSATHTTGATVVDYVTGTHVGAMTKGILIAHEQTGVHKAGLVLPTPKITTSINDANGNEVIKTPATSSAVNEITVTNAATGGVPTISATGGDTAINLNLRGKGLAKTVTIGAGATTIFPYDYVVSGCVWSGDAYGSTRVASMTAGVVVINGNPITVAAVTSRTFTASKDTYVDVLDAGDGTGTVVYTEATNNAASSALAANSIRIGIIITGAGNIADAGSVNQGQESKVLPIASSIPYAVTDSLGNLICPRDPQRKVLGYRQRLTSATATTIAQVTGVSVPVIIPTGRKVKISVSGESVSNNSTGAGVTVSVWSGVVNSGTRLADSIVSSVSGVQYPLSFSVIHTPSSASTTFNLGLDNTGANTATINATSTSPIVLMVELV